MFGGKILPRASSIMGYGRPEKSLTLPCVILRSILASRHSDPRMRGSEVDWRVVVLIVKGGGLRMDPTARRYKHPKTATVTMRSHPPKTLGESLPNYGATAAR